MARPAAVELGLVRLGPSNEEVGDHGIAEFAGHSAAAEPRGGRSPSSRAGSAAANRDRSPSVEESVYEEAEYAGNEGPDAADPPRAEGKHEAGASFELGKDLDPEEGADALETREEALEVKKPVSEERQDEDVISLDSPD